MSDHRCLFCDHVFTGRRRKFCTDCLPPHGSVHPKVYQAKYMMLYRACGLMSGSDVVASKLGPAFKPPKPPKPTHKCFGCDAMVERHRKWCSTTCASRHRRHAVRQSRIENGTAAEPPVRSASAQRVIFAHQAKAATRKVQRRDVRSMVADLPVVGSCVVCGGDLRPWWTLCAGTKRRRQCYECRLSRKKESITRRGYVPPAVNRGGAVVACLECGATFQRNTQRKFYCSESCSVAAARDSDRRSRMKRRAAVAGQPYTMAELISRSGSRCHLCTKPVDASLSGMHPLGPTIDHILPLSAGGADCSTNVALAHRQCNLRRGARGATQLRLVG